MAQVHKEPPWRQVSAESQTSTGVCRETHLHRYLRETPAQVSSERHTCTGVCRYTCSPLAGDMLMAGQHLWGRETGEELPLSGRVSPSHTRQGAPSGVRAISVPELPSPETRRAQTRPTCLWVRGLLLLQDQDLQTWKVKRSHHPLSPRSSADSSVYRLTDLPTHRLLLLRL